jgi:hypothetical protein
MSIRVRHVYRIHDVKNFDIFEKKNIFVLEKSTKKEKFINFHRLWQKGEENLLIFPKKGHVFDICI